MTEHEKIEFLQDAVFKLFGKKVTVNLDDGLNLLGLDSLDIIELQLYYEEQFNIELPDTVMIKTVQNLIDLM
jgi:acyl carrier protein